MSTIHLVDPEMRGVLEGFPAFQITHEVLPPLREHLNQMAAEMAKMAPPNTQITMTERAVPGLTGPDVNVLIYRPIDQAGPLPVILEMHGGGYVMGSAAMMHSNSQMMASAVGCVVVTVDYRLAPDTPHPGPLEDCYTVLKWLHDEAGNLMVDPERIAVSGQSAGAGLAAALALFARDRGEVRIAFQHLNSPMIDDRTCVTADPHPYTGEFVWTVDSNKFGWTALLGQAPGGPDVSPYAAAARATNLSDLPPTFIAVGALDLFLDEDLDYALRLTRAGIPVELHVYPGTYHGYQAAFASRVVAEANRDSIAALKRALHPAV
jgi:acetyl esterase/lipase